MFITVGTWPRSVSLAAEAPRHAKCSPSLFPLVNITCKPEHHAPTRLAILAVSLGAVFRSAAFIYCFADRLIAGTGLYEWRRIPEIKDNSDY